MESGVFFCWFEILTFVRMTVMKAGMTVKSVGDPDLRQDDGVKCRNDGDESWNDVILGG